MQKNLILLIRIYQYIIGPLLGDRCRFYPSCSVYATEAIARFGVIKGLWFSAQRLSRCHPWHPGGFDPCPGSQPSENL